MRLNPRFILIISVISGFLAFTMTMQTIKGMQKVPDEVLIATAMKDFNVGDLIKPGDVQLLVAPKGIDMNVVIRSLEGVNNKKIRNSIKRGQAIKTFDLVSKDDSLLNLIPEGYRASNIALNLPPETMAFLKFGARVDVLFSFTSPDRFETKTIIKNVMVMKAVEGQISAQNPNQRLIYVTLAVRPEATEMLAYAVQKGKLDLSVRSPDETNVQEEYISMEELTGKKAPPKSQILSGTEIEVIKRVDKQKVRVTS